MQRRAGHNGTARVKRGVLKAGVKCRSRGLDYIRGVLFRSLPLRDGCNSLTDLHWIVIFIGNFKREDNDFFYHMSSKEFSFVFGASHNF
ncbi:hypothetical protein NPIL_656621 [Nephila pilipes]|uniref:Uncharacterized protein n=1 Tax=Nephila pilipes TaxID=299642 RepID=A0A8X6PR48_NEPPI|nr:hypothetical protein NPIL_656621 [Nephila pilipes]